MADTVNSEKNILIADMRRIGFVHLEGVEKYIAKHAPKACFLVTPSKPHENVLKYAEKIPSLKIIVSSNFQREKEKIVQEYPGITIDIIDSYHLAGRDGMLDGA